jgi:hypothetical protein
VRCHHDVLTTRYPHSLQITGFYQFIRFAAPPGGIFTLIPGIDLIFFVGLSDITIGPDDVTIRIV